MVLKNDRVKGILELVERFKVCDVAHITKLFYPGRKYGEQKARLKMSALVKEGTLKRKRSDVSLSISTT